MVIMVKIIGAPDLHKQGVGAPGGSGFPAVGLKFRTGNRILANQPLVGIYKVCSDTVNFFPEAAAKGIVIVLGDALLAQFFKPRQPVFGVVDVAEHPPVGCLADRVAVGVIVKDHGDPFGGQPVSYRVVGEGLVLSRIGRR